MEPLRQTPAFACLDLARSWIAPTSAFFGVSFLTEGVALGRQQAAHISKSVMSREQLVSHRADGAASV